MNPKLSDGGSRTLPPGAAVLRHLLRPHSMSMMAALEKTLASEGKKADADASASSSGKGGAPADESAVQQLETSLADFNSAVRRIIESDDIPERARQLDFAPTLPFLMLPFNLILMLMRPTSKTRGDAGEGVGAVLRSAADSGRRFKMPVAVRELALQCIATMVRASQSSFATGYGSGPTLDILVTLAFTLSECSLEGPSGADAGGRTVSDDAGLTAGKDALRVACLECLEAILRASDCSHAQTETVTGLKGSGISEDDRAPARRSVMALSNPLVGEEEEKEAQNKWSEIRESLQSIAQGGLVAQMVQELLVCCQAGSGRGTPVGAEAGGKVQRIGVGVSCLAARCLDALSSFITDVKLWRKFLPGTFSGLFRAIRAMGVEPPSSASSGARQSTLTGVSLHASLGISGGGSNSALAETCLATLAKVLLICEGKAVVDNVGMEGSGSTQRGMIPSGVHVGTRGSGPAAPGDDGGDPLLVLRRLATASNSFNRSSLPDRGDPSLTSDTLPVPQPTEKEPRRLGDSSGRWEKETSGRLRVLLAPLLAFCRVHPGWRVRRGAAHFASALLGGGRGNPRWDNGTNVEYGGGEGVKKGEDGEMGDMGGVPVEGSREGRQEGLLASLTGLLVEALVGLVLDDMPQVSCAAREGLAAFRETLPPLRWLALRGLMLERFCSIAEGLPALARAADEKRLRAGFDLVAGYLSLLRTDARVALDARLPTLLSCLCETLEFDQDFNVQVLEGSSDGRECGGNHGQEQEVDNSGVSGAATAEAPKYYRRVLANAREDTTLRSARRALRLLGAYGDLPSLVDAALVCLEGPYPLPPSRSGQRAQARFRRSSSLQESHEVAFGGKLGGEVRGGGGDGQGDSYHRRRVLAWLKSRLPMAWILNEALLGRVSGIPLGTVRREGNNDESERTAARGAEIGIERTLAISLLDRLLASQAFSLWVSATDAEAMDYLSKTDEDYGFPEGQGKSVITYTRSGEVVGARVGGRIQMASRQVLDAHATLVSLTVEILGTLAEVCGVEFGEAFLRRALYPLLEKAASTHRVVSQAAMATLWRVRVACGKFTDVPDLLAANMDYVVDDVVCQVAVNSSSSAGRLRGQGSRGSAAIVLRSRRGGNRSGETEIPAVVEVVLRIGGPAMGPALVRDLAGVTLREVDASSWDPTQAGRSLGALRAVVACITVPGSAEAFPEVVRELSGGFQRKDERGKQMNWQEKPGAERDSSSSLQRSELRQSPWFRQLYFEFATVSDIEDATREAEREPATMELLKELQRHREQLMGLGGLDVGDAQLEDDEEEEDKEMPERSLPEPDEEGRRIADSQEVKTLAEVLARSCHFLSIPSLETQASALACMRDCVLKLAAAGAEAALLPHVHRAWQPLMRSFREFLSPGSTSTFALSGGGRQLAAGGADYVYDSPSSRRAVLLHALESVDALVHICGEFLSMKVPEDLWPLVKVLLLRYTTSITRQSGNSTRTSTKSTNSTIRRGPRELLVGPSRLILQPTSRVSVDYSSGSSWLLSSSTSSSTAGPSAISAREGRGSIAQSRSESDYGSGHGHGWDPREDSVDVKVMTRALGCLEGLCRSSECRLYMAPLAREVALLALPCLSSAGSKRVRVAAESLFDALVSLDGDGVWLLLLQSLNMAGVLSDDPVRQQPRALFGSSTSGRARGEAEELAEAITVTVTAKVSGLNRRDSQGLVSDGSLKECGKSSFLPSPPSGLVFLPHGLPCQLAERASVFTRTTAEECAPAVARLITSIKSQKMGR